MPQSARLARAKFGATQEKTGQGSCEDFRKKIFARSLSGDQVMFHCGAQSELIIGMIGGAKI